MQNRTASQASIPRSWHLLPTVTLSLLSWNVKVSSPCLHQPPTAQIPKINYPVRTFNRLFRERLNSALQLPPPPLHFFQMVSFRLFPNETFVSISHLPILCCICRPSHPCNSTMLIVHNNRIYEAHSISSLLGQNIFLSPFFVNTSNNNPSLMVWAKLWHP